MAISDAVFGMALIGGVESASHIANGEVGWSTLPRDGNLELARAVGFEIGDPISDHDGLFLNAKWPNGWTKVHSEGGMHYHILDDKGRVRGSISMRLMYDTFAYFRITPRFSVGIHNEELPPPKKTKTKVRRKVTREEYTWNNFRGIIIADNRFYDEDIDEYDPFVGGRQGRPLSSYVIIEEEVEVLETIPYEEQRFCYAVFDNAIGKWPKNVVYHTAYHQHKEDRYDPTISGRTLSPGMEAECQAWLNKNMPNWRDVTAYWE